MDKDDKLKCYRRTAKDGHRYTTCDDKGEEVEKPKPKKLKLRIKTPKEVEKPKPKKLKLRIKTPKEAATAAMSAIKAVENISGSVKLKKQFIERLKDMVEKIKYERVLKATKDFEETNKNKPIDEIVEPLPNTTAKPKPKPANFDMLRPEIRKNILAFAGNPKKVIEEKIIDINLNKGIKTRVIESVLKDMNKGSLKELNISTSTQIYNADMRRKMKALGKGFAVGGSNERDVYEILDDVEEALGIDEYMRFLPEVEKRLDGVVINRKKRQAREREQEKKIKLERKKQEQAEKDALGDDDFRRYSTAADVRDYMKWDKAFAKKVTEIAKSGMKERFISPRFDNSLTKVKNFVINELRKSVIFDGGRDVGGSYNEVKERIVRYKSRLDNPSWRTYDLF